MWVPQSEQEIEGVAKSGGLEETDIFDVKGQLPVKSQHLASDVAAMATGGGVLLYGVGEDGAGRPTRLTPIPLKGAREKVDQILRAGIAEPPFYRMRVISSMSVADHGYLVLIVPASERAPHMVIVKGDNRYYRRSLSGNVPMTEAEVAVLYERRHRLQQQANAEIMAQLATNIVAPTTGIASMHVAIRPVAASPEFFVRATGSGLIVTPAFLALGEACKWLLPTELNVLGRDLSHEALHPFAQSLTWKRVPHGHVARAPRDVHQSPMGTVELIVTNDALIRCFVQRVGGQRQQDGPVLIHKEDLAAYVSRLGRMAGRFYEQCGYLGAVDVGIRVTGVLGAVEFLGDYPYDYSEAFRFEDEEYQRVARLPAGILTDDWRAIGGALLEDFFDSLTQYRYHPFLQP
jgi:hypothetical protein